MYWQVNLSVKDCFSETFSVMKFVMHTTKKLHLFYFFYTDMHFAFFCVSSFQQYAPLLAVFSTQGQSELILLQKVQEYCYDNIHFMKAFQKIVVLFYKGKSL